MKDYLRKLLIECLPKIHPMLNNDFIQEEKIVKIQDDGSINLDKRIQVLYSPLVQYAWIVRKILPAWTDSISNEVIKLFRDTFDYKDSFGKEEKNNLNYLIERFLLPKYIVYYLESAHSFEFIEDIFNLSYEKLILFLESETDEKITSALILNFDSDIDQKEIIDKHISIRKVLKNELNEIISRELNFFGYQDFEIFDLSESNFLIESKEEVPKAISIPITNDRGLNEVVLCLRLCKKGFVTLGNLHQKTRLDLGKGYVMGSMNILRKREPKYFLDNATIVDLKTLWKKYKSIKNDNPQNLESINIALNRLRFIYQRYMTEDNLIDAWIGLESIFGFGFDMELSYRISLRICHFLNGGELLFRKIKKSYGHRSEIVHGESIKSTDLNSSFEITLEALRNSIRKYILENYNNTQELNEKIENSLQNSSLSTRN